MQNRQDRRILESLNRGYTPESCPAPPGYIALLRLFAASVFLRWGWVGLASWNSPVSFRSQVSAWIADPSHPFWGYQAFLKQTVLPHIETVHLVLTCTELAVGVLLALGALTRLAAFVALLLTINFWFAAGFYSPRAPMYEALAVMSLVLMIAGAGRVLGADTLLARRAPNSPFW